MLEQQIILIIKSQLGINQVPVIIHISLKQLFEQIASVHQINVKALRGCKLQNLDLMNDQIDLLTPIIEIPGFQNGVIINVDFDCQQKKEQTQLQKLKRLSDFVSGNELNPNCKGYEQNNQNLPTKCAHSERVRCQYCLTFGVPSQYCGHGSNAKCIKCTNGIVPSIYCQHHPSVKCLNCMTPTQQYVPPLQQKVVDNNLDKRIQADAKENQEKKIEPVKIIQAKNKKPIKQEDMSMWLLLQNMIFCRRKKQKRE